MILDKVATPAYQGSENTSRNPALSIQIGFQTGTEGSSELAAQQNAMDAKRHARATSTCASSAGCAGAGGAAAGAGRAGSAGEGRGRSLLREEVTPWETLRRTPPEPPSHCARKLLTRLSCAAGWLRVLMGDLSPP